MKELILMRHAKSGWKKDELDHDRTLTSSGIETAKHQTQKLAHLEDTLDLIFCSSAKRTHETATILNSHFKTKFQEEHTLYLTDTMKLLKAVNGLSNSFERVALVGHNPGISQLASYLGNVLIPSVPPGTFVKLTFDYEDWGLISGATGNLVYTVYPEG